MSETKIFHKKDLNLRSLTSQTVSKYIKFEHDGNNKKLYDKELSIIDPSSFR